MHIFADMIKIVFLCHGNICRSPMAEYIMKDMVRKAGLESEFLISSAAVSSEETGNSVYPQALDKLAEKGIPAGSHRAHRITVKEFEESALVVVMDRSNLDFLSHIVGQNAVYNSDKVHLLMEYASDVIADEGHGAGRGRFRYPGVADPWYTRDFERSFQDISAGCRGLVARLSSGL